MKYLIFLLLAVPALAGGPSRGAFATVTYTYPGHPPFVDSGVVVEDHQYAAAGFEGYILRFVVFTDHTDEFFLDDKGGRVDVIYR